MSKHQGEPRYFTAPEWINKETKILSGWPINKRQGHISREHSGGTNRSKALLRRIDAGLLKKGT